MMKGNVIVSGEEWLAARKKLLQQEKAFTRARDELSAARRALPWVEVSKDYVFDTPDGKRSLGDLFGDHSQLIIQHYMYGPDWQEGCRSCAFWADQFNPTVPHLAARDVAFAVVSQAPSAVFAATITLSLIPMRRIARIKTADVLRA